VTDAIVSIKTFGNATLREDFFAEVFCETKQSEQKF